MLRVAFAALAALLIAARLPAQPVGRPRAVILGTVSDTSLSPIVAAEVSVGGSVVRVSTDSNGRFHVVHVPAGRFVVIARSIGYRPETNVVELAEGDTLRLAFTLEPAPTQALRAVVVMERTVSRRLQEFNDRRKLGFGEFFTRSDIEKINPIIVGDILQRVKSLNVSADGSVVGSARGRCPTAIYLDGIPVAYGKLDDLPTPNDIAAIEVYPGPATLPLWLPQGQLGMKAGCGAVLVWTRDGTEGPGFQGS